MYYKRECENVHLLGLDQGDTALDRKRSGFTLSTSHISVNEVPHTEYFKTIEKRWNVDAFLKERNYAEKNPPLLVLVFAYLDSYSS
jgi:hypothetical protein